MDSKRMHAVRLRYRTCVSGRREERRVEALRKPWCRTASIAAVDSQPRCGITAFRVPRTRTSTTVHMCQGARWTELTIITVAARQSIKHQASPKVVPWIPWIMNLPPGCVIPSLCMRLVRTSSLMIPIMNKGTSIVPSGSHIC